MATMRKRGERWHVQVRRNSRPAISRSFHLKSDALAWAHQQELEAERQGLPTAHKALRDITVANVDEVIPRKRGADRETFPDVPSEFAVTASQASDSRSALHCGIMARRRQRCRCRVDYGCVWDQTVRTHRRHK